MERENGRPVVRTQIVDEEEAALFTVANPGHMDQGDVFDQLTLDLRRINAQLTLLTDTTIEPGEQLGG